MSSSVAEKVGKSMLDVLPPELVVQIISHLAADRDRPALCSLARTCRLLQVECEKHIYATIELFSARNLYAILKALEGRNDRMKVIETLRILYRFDPTLGATTTHRGVFNMLLPFMTALKNLHIESPFDNFKWGDAPGRQWVELDMENYREAIEGASLKQKDMGGMIGGNGRPVRQLAFNGNAGLAKLERLVIHSHGLGTDFWELGTFHCIFRHPSLRYLHVSCVVLPKSLPELRPYQRTTPLETLIFDECELEPDSVCHILQTAKALKHLTLGENVYNNDRTRIVVPRLSRQPDRSLFALKQAAHSLETITHHDPWWRVIDDPYGHRPIPGDGMRDFHRLKFMQMEPCSFLHQCIIAQAQAPPNLETLRLSHARPRLSDPVPRFSVNVFETLPKFEPYTHLASLKTLEFTQGASAESWQARSGYICQEDRLRERHAYAYKLYQHGITLKVYLEATWREELLPPFLQGEPKPRLVSVYDSSLIGFRRHISSPNDIDGSIRSEFEVPAGPAGAVVMSHIFATISAHLPAGYQAGDVSIFTKDSAPTAPSAPPPPPTNQEPPETDQLNMPDIQRIRNEVTRRLNKVWMDMDKEDKEEDDRILEEDQRAMEMTALDFGDEPWGTADFDDPDDLDDIDDEFVEEWADMLEQEEDEDDDNDEDEDEDDLDDDDDDEDDLDDLDEDFLQHILEEEVAVDGDGHGAADVAMGGAAVEGSGEVV